MKASLSHTQARRPSLLPPRLLHLTLLHTRPKTWSSQGHLSPPRTLRLWTLVSSLTVPHLRGIKCATSYNIFSLTSDFLNKKNVSFCCPDKPNALSEPRGEEESLTKKGKKKKSVRWAEEEQLKEYFYFDLDETERGKDGTVSLITLRLCSDEGHLAGDNSRCCFPSKRQ